MFRTVFSCIIRSSRLYIQQQAFVKRILLSACQRLPVVGFTIGIRKNVFIIAVLYCELIAESTTQNTEILVINCVSSKSFDSCHLRSKDLLLYLV